MAEKHLYYYPKVFHFQKFLKYCKKPMNLFYISNFSSGGIKSQLGTSNTTVITQNKLIFTQITLGDAGI